MSQGQNKKSREAVDKRMLEAAERFSEIQRVIAPYVKKTVTETPMPEREWESSEHNITRIAQ